MRFSLLKERVEAALVGTPHEGVLVAPGPDVPDVPDEFVMLTRTGGPGLSTEDLFDGVGYQVRCAGLPFDYDSAEDLALVLDRGLREDGYSQPVGVDGPWLLSLQRNGSPPTPLLVDTANRHHFVASYVVQVESARA